MSFLIFDEFIEFSVFGIMSKLNWRYHARVYEIHFAVPNSIFCYSFSNAINFP